MAREQTLECSQRAVLVLARDTTRVVEVHLATEHRRGPRQLVGILVEPRQPRTDRGLDRLGQGCWPGARRFAELELAGFEQRPNGLDRE